MKSQNSSPDLNSHTENELQEERNVHSDDEMDDEEVKKYKKENSYTYWVNKNVESFPQT